MEDKEKVLTTLEKANKALRNGEIAELSGLKKDKVEKAIKILKKEDKIISPKRCFWQLK